MNLQGMDDEKDFWIVLLRWFFAATIIFMLCLTLIEIFGK
jgi:hypothetical protein